MNDGLPGEAVHWTWQPGPWLMVDRVTGHIAALHLPDFDPQVSDVVWFRDYAAYCGIATTVKGGLMAVVAELGARKAVVQQKLSAWPAAERSASGVRDLEVAANADARNHPADRWSALDV